MKFILIALIFISQLAQADVVLSVGTGKGITGESGTPFERMVALGYEHDFTAGFFVRPEAGYFLDISGQGLSSMWAAPLFGVRAVSQVGPILHLAVGPGYLQNPDNILGGHFQFSLEGGIGIVDSHFGIQAVWKHLSSAGFEMPNHGRDFIALQVSYLGL
jgi:hypothetical protein